MKRLAFASPLPPDTSGIADYSAELLPALAEHFEIELFTNQPGVTDPTLAGRFPVRAVAELAAAEAEDGYDAILYQLGNSAAHHGEIYRSLLEIPGVVVLHEFMLHHLVRDLTLNRGGNAEFREEMRYCYGETGRRMAGRILHANDLPEMWTYPLFERAVDAARGLIVHSRATRDRVLASRPSAAVDVVPHHLSLHGAESAGSDLRRSLLAVHGLPEDSLVVASFGHLTEAKRLEVALAAFSRLRRRHPEAVYLLVGEPSPAYGGLSDLLESELGAGVHTTGRVPLATLLDHMAACDVAVNLRHPTGGETSGACLRLLGLGRPVIVTDAGWFSEIPDDCCVKVPVGDGEEELLEALLVALADDETLRRRMGANAAIWAAGNHRIERCAAGYARSIERLAAAPPRRSSAAPPLAPAAPGDLAARLAGDLGRALADLGHGPRTDPGAEELETAVARTVVDLGLHRNES